MKNKRVTFISSLGAGFEYYDFVIYMMMAPYISKLFFHTSDLFLAHLKTFFIFASAYLARPLGGVLMGVLSDIYGRKSVFAHNMLLMAGATFGMGMLPTYESVGPAAGMGILVLRLFQGLSFGAELPSAATFIMEHQTSGSQGRHAGFLISSTALGAMMASGILFILTRFCPEPHILQGFWRLPFLLGGSLAFVVFYIRRSLTESPEFFQYAMDKNINVKDWRQHIVSQPWRAVIGGWLLALFSTTLVVVYLFFPTYLTQHTAHTSQEIYLAMTYGLLWSICAALIGGRLLDIYGPSRVMKGCLGGFILFLPFFYGFFSSNHFMYLVLSFCGYQTFLTIATTGLFLYLKNIFPVSVRVSSVGFCYNAAYCLACLSPIILSVFLKQYAWPSWCVMLYLLGVTCFSILGFFLLDMDKKHLKK